MDDGTHGDGKMSYIGGGVMTKMTQKSGTYVEGSLRAGRVKSDYTGRDDATAMSYDNSNTYNAGHIGVGQEWKVAGGVRIKEALINSACVSWRIFFARTSAENPPQSTTLRPVFRLVRMKKSTPI